MAEEEPDAAHLKTNIVGEVKVPFHAAMYWDAFAQLCSERSAVTDMMSCPNPHGGPMLLFPYARELPIPWSAIHRYAKRRGLTGNDFVSFERLVTAMDDEYMKINAERRRGLMTDQSDDEG